MRGAAISRERTPRAWTKARSPNLIALLRRRRLGFFFFVVVVASVVEPNLGFVQLGAERVDALLLELALGFLVDAARESVGGVGDGAANYASNRTHSGDGATKGFAFIRRVSLLLLPWRVAP